MKIVLALLLMVSVANAEQIGDMDLDGTVGLSEAVIALRITAGLDPGVALGTHTPAVITVKTSNGDFDNPIDAMNSIIDSSEENPYTILIGPGTFNLYIDPLIMKPYVKIIGSGQAQTTITGTGFTGTFNDWEDASLIVGAEGSLLKDLTIINSTNIDIAFATTSVYFSNINHASMENVTIQESSISRRCAGMYTKNAKVTLKNVHISVAAHGVDSLNIYGMQATDSSIIEARNSTFNVNASSASNSGLKINESELYAHDLTINVSGVGSDSNVGVYSYKSKSSISSTSITVSGGSVNNYGVSLTQIDNCVLSNSNISTSGTDSLACRQSAGSSLIIYNCSLSGAYAVHSSATDSVHYIDIIKTEIMGEPRLIGNINCERCVDADGALLNDRCKTP